MEEVEAALQTASMREFLTHYNQMVQGCFTRCVHTLWEPRLTDGELRCSHQCVHTLIASQGRISQAYLIAAKVLRPAATADGGDGPAS